MKILKKTMTAIRHPIQSARMAHIGAVVGLTSLSQSVAAQDQDLAGLSENLEGQVLSVGSLIVIAFGVGGLFLVGWGLWKLFNRTPQQQEPVGKAIGMVVGGGLLLGMSAIAAIGMNTFGLGSGADKGGVLDSI